MSFMSLITLGWRDYIYDRILSHLGVLLHFNERLNKTQLYRWWRKIQYHPIFCINFWVRLIISSGLGEILIFSLLFSILLLLFSKDENECKTDSVKEKKKLFKDLQEGATSAGLYLHNIL